MWKPVVVPFQNSQSLPTLPTTDEIRACTNVLWETMAAKIVTVNDNIIVKYGGGVNEWESQALVYLEQHVPEVPVPRLYAMYYDSNQLMLITQRVPGVQLNSIWPSLAPSEKDDIITKLQLIFNNMTIGNFWGHSPANLPLLLAWSARFYEKYFPRVLQGHRPRLTHGDVQQKNLMVAENPSRSNDQGGRSFEVVLVDWENSGWFPDFWEFFCASDPFRFQWDQDWSWRVQEFVQVWLAEVAIMQLIDKDLGF